MKIVYSLTALSICVSLSFLTGFSWRDLWAHRPPNFNGLSTLMSPASMRKQTPTELFQEQFNHIVSSAAVNANPKKVKYAAMSGMFSALGDPHTNFLEPVDADSLKLETRGDFVGIGARLGGDPSGARVATVFKNSPAEKVGVKAGDTIIAVDGKSTAGVLTDDIVKKIRGVEGTIVHIRVSRIGSPSPLNFSIKRATVVIPSAEGRMIENQGVRAGYIVISGFAHPTTEQLDMALDDMLDQNPDGLVLDLRGNPGGLLDAAVNMLGRFVDGKPAVSTRRRGGREEQLFTPIGHKKNINIPIVILINEDSASAAEIFSGVMQEYKKATLIGEHSYGKSSVQNVFPFVDFSSAKVTIAKYYLPSGRDIGRKLDEDGEYVSGGLRPDIDLGPDLSGDTIMGQPNKDPHLQKAMDVIRSKKAN